MAKIRMMRILVVDDEPNFLRLVKTRLEVEGYDVITTASGKSGIEMVKNKKPDMVFLDIKMPDIDGLEALRNIRSFDKTTPVVMVTAHGSVDTWMDSVELKIYSFIPKGEPGNNTTSKMLKVIDRYKKSRR